MTLVINYLEIENFKSYYGKNILGPFHQSFNAVIGPNGSGKSNVIDSLLFVFGFRAQKIRSKKLSVLIHNSDQHPNVNSCSVNIFFRKIQETTTGKFEVVPNSEFTVKRTAYKDNSSDYYIDDRKVQFKEVGQLLRDCGVDLDHNRFLILQGEVEQISLLKPKAANEHEEGLLEYLEDIIGTIKYKPMLEEVNVEIDKVNEIRTEKNNRVQNLEKDKASLEGPKNEAINFLKLENTLIEKKNYYYQARIHSTEEELKVQKESFSSVQNELDDLNRQVTEFNKDNEVRVAELTLKKKDHEKKAKLSEKLKKRFEDFEKEDVEIRESIKHSKDSIKKLEKNIETESDKLASLKELPEKNQQRIEELTEELANLEEQLEPANQLLQKKMEKVNQETKPYHAKKDSFKDELGALEAATGEAKSKMDLAQAELDEYLKNQNAEKKKLEETRRKVEDSSKLAAERESGVQELRQSIPRMEEEVRKASVELAEVTEKEKNLSDALNRNRTKFSEAQNSFSKNRNRSRVLNFLMQMRAEGKLTGVYGRLGDLAAIDEKYDIAISTACGPLDNIVVDSIDTAQRCVELLKSSNTGSATFLALDKQEKWREHVNRKFTA